MKKCFLYPLLVVFTFIGSYGLFACRSVKKSRSSTDSTIVRLAEQSQSWQSESIQEIVIDSDDLSFVTPGSPLLSLPYLSPGQSTHVLEKLGILRIDSSQVKMGPQGNGRTGTRITIRTIGRQFSQQSSQLKEEKQGHSYQLDKSIKSDASQLLTISLITIVVLLVIIILYKSKHPD